MPGLKQSNMTRVFLEIDGLAALEQQEEWKKALKLLYELWHNDRMNVQKLCRFSSECWYVLSQWDYWMHASDLSMDQVKNDLIQATDFGIRYFENDAMFLWLSGYMISQFPFLFYNGNADEMFVRWEHIGKNMLRASVQIQPENSIAKILYWGSMPDCAEAYLAERRRFHPYLSAAFPGHTWIEEYFKDVLS